MGKLIELIKTLQSVVKELDLSVNETVIFEQACSYHRGMLANKNFKENRDILNPVKQTKSNEPEPQNKGIDGLPTDKQLNFMKKNKLRIIDGLTKEEAKFIIKTFIDNQNKFFKEGGNQNFTPKGK
jgi:hypothetical protein